jgi:hypothetical protein
MSGRVHITDHAVLRYLERILGVDIDALRQTIAADCARHQGAPVVKTMVAKYCLINGRVVTVYAADEPMSYDAYVRLCEAAQHDTKTRPDESHAAPFEDKRL